MRTLSLDESIESISTKSVDVQYSDKRFYLNKVILFWNFLESQSRLKNALEQIETEYSYINDQIGDIYDDRRIHKVEELFYELNSEQKQGAFAFFIMKKIKNEDHWTSPYDLVIRIFHPGLEYEVAKDKFSELIFKPFVNLVVEVLEESKTDNLDNYFSKKEVKETEDKIDKIIEELVKLSLGQEVIYEELQDLKEQLKVLNKKNWLQLLKGKLVDIGIAEGSLEIIKFIYKNITGDDLPLLE
jgi:hypothetical protein